MITDLQSYTPLLGAEMLFLERKVKFYRRVNRTITTLVPSQLALPQKIAYTIEISEGLRGFLQGTVRFGLPLEEEPLKALSLNLDRRAMGELWVGAQPRNQMLVLAEDMTSEDLYQDVLELGLICDQIYPLIMHIRRTRCWEEDLVRLALEPIQGNN